MKELMTPAQITAVLRSALAGEDPRPLHTLLDPGVRWAPTPDSEIATPGRAVVLAWYAARNAARTPTYVDEIFTYPDAAVVALAGPTRTGPRLYQVFRITDGRIAEVCGYADRSQALEAAHQAP